VLHWWKHSESWKTDVLEEKPVLVPLLLPQTLTHWLGIEPRPVAVVKVPKPRSSVIIKAICGTLAE
jgi:hypothetical protein